MQNTETNTSPEKFYLRFTSETWGKNNFQVENFSLLPKWLTNEYFSLKFKAFHEIIEFPNVCFFSYH